MEEHRLKVLKDNGEACDLKNATIDTCEVKRGVSFDNVSCLHIMKNSQKEIKKKPALFLSCTQNAIVNLKLII